MVLDANTELGAVHRSRSVPVLTLPPAAPAVKAKGGALQIRSVSNKGAVLVKNGLQGQAERMTLVGEGRERRTL